MAAERVIRDEIYHQKRRVGDAVSTMRDLQKKLSVARREVFDMQRLMDRRKSVLRGLEADLAKLEEINR